MWAQFYITYYSENWSFKHSLLVTIKHTKDLKLFEKCEETVKG